MKKFREIFGLALNYKKYLAATFIFSTLNSILSIFTFAAVIPLLNIIFNIGEKASLAPDPLEMGALKFKYENGMYQLNQYIQENGAAKALMYVCIALVIITFLKNLVNYLGLRNIAVIRTAVSKDLRTKAYDKISRLSLSFFSNERKGDLMSRMTNDLMEIEFSVIGTIEILFKAPIMIIISLTALFFMSWQLTVFALIFLPVSGYVISRVSKGLKNAAKRGKDKLSELLVVLEETLSGMRIIKAFNAEEQFNEKHDEKNEEYFQLMKRLYKREYLSSPVSEFISITAIAILLYIGGLIVLSGDELLDAGLFIFYLITFSQIIPPAKSLSDAIFKMKKGEASIDRLNDIIHADVDIKDLEHAVSLEEFKERIVFDKVSFSYEDKKVIDDISFTINKGESIALVGPSGGGKSTLANLIARFYDAQEGVITMDGIPIKKMKVKSLRDKMGIVTQDSILFNDSIENNIALGSETIDKERIRNAGKSANAEEYIDQLEGGYNFVIGDGGNKLSGGQKQRLSIARALYKNPPILILDEATSALDTKSEKLVQDAIDKLMKNRTAVVIAHRLSTIQNVDKILVIEDGKIAQQGTHAELMEQKGTYKTLVQMQELG